MENPRRMVEQCLQGRLRIPHQLGPAWMSGRPLKSSAHYSPSRSFNESGPDSLQGMRPAFSCSFFVFALFFVRLMCIASASLLFLSNPTKGLNRLTQGNELRFTQPKL